MLQDTSTAIPLQPQSQPVVVKKHKRKLPKRSIVDADLVSSKATDSARIMDDLLLPSEHDRIILSEIFDANNDKEPVHASLLPRVVLGVPNKRKPSHLLRTVNHKTYKERLNTTANNIGDDLDLSRHVIIPPSSTAAATTTLNKPTHAKQARREQQEEEEEEGEKENTRTGTADMENYVSHSVATTAISDKITSDIIDVKDDDSVLDELLELMADDEILRNMDRSSISPESAPDITMKDLRQTTDDGKAMNKTVNKAEEDSNSMSQIEDSDTSMQGSKEALKELAEGDVLQNVENKDMSAETDGTFKVKDVDTDNMSANNNDTHELEDENESIENAVNKENTPMELDGTGNNDLQDDPTMVRISDGDKDHSTISPSKDSSTEVVLPIKSQHSIDDTHYEQECYVEIKSYALEYMDTSSSSSSSSGSSSSSEEEEATLPDQVPEKDELSLNTQHQERLPIAAVKQVDERIESPPLQLSQALIHTPSVIQSEDQVEEEDDEEEEEKDWMHIDMDTDNEKEESVSEKIFNLMAVKLPAAIPMDKTTSTNNKQQHVRLERLKSIQALDWIQNADITNIIPVMVDKKSRQIALKRKERLAIKRQRPYVIRKRIKSIIWTENV